SGRSAVIYATLLGITGFAVLVEFVNLLTVAIGFGALFFYVVVYGFWKRRSTLGTVIGSIAGATPPAAGYCAVTNNIDTGAAILFLILVCWQMPHFYSIAVYRLRDYAAASLPVLPVKKGIHITKIYIVLYITAFIGAAQLLTIYGYTGYTYAVVLAILGLAWLWKAIRGFNAPDYKRWARTMFLFSLIVITTLSSVIAANAVLP
ncbi:MAG: UbiA family prenyltransferase, partial [Patescibacteria group bacterium]